MQHQSVERNKTRPGMTNPRISLVLHDPTAYTHSVTGNEEMYCSLNLSEGRRTVEHDLWCIDEPESSYIGLQSKFVSDHIVYSTGEIENHESVTSSRYWCDPVIDIEGQVIVLNACMVVKSYRIRAVAVGAWLMPQHRLSTSKLEQISQQDYIDNILSIPLIPSTWMNCRRYIECWKWLQTAPALVISISHRTRQRDGR